MRHRDSFAYISQWFVQKEKSLLLVINKKYILSLALKLLFLFIPEVRKCICYSNKTVNMALKYVLKNKNTVWININKDLNFFVLLFQQLIFTFILLYFAVQCFVTALYIQFSYFPNTGIAVWGRKYFPYYSMFNYGNMCFVFYNIFLNSLRVLWDVK